MLNAQNQEAQLCCKCQLGNNIKKLPNCTAEASARRCGAGRQRQSLALGFAKDRGCQGAWDMGSWARSELGEKRGRTAAEQNRSGEMRRGGRGGQHGQSGDCNHLRRSLAPPATGAAAGARARPKRGRTSPGPPCSGVPDPGEPQGGRAEDIRRLSSHLSRVGVPISKSHRRR